MTTPNIRFKSFSTEWSNSTLETLFTEFKSGKSITSQTIFEEGAYPVFGGNGLRGYTDTYTHDDEFFLIGRQGALCGNINDFHGKAFNSEHAIVCIANEDNSTKFLSQRLKHLNLNKLSESSAQPGLAVNKLLKLKLFVPSHEEQQKIADFLTTVDEKINFLKKKKQLLEQYKKGVMQEIFSQELRFKDEEGKDFPEWDEKKLGDICEITKGRQLNVENMVEDGLFPALNGGITYSGYTNSWNTEKDTITVSEGGNSCGFVSFIKEDFWCGGHCYALKNIKEGVIKIYLYQNLKNYEASIMRMRVGSGLPNIQKKGLSDFSVKVPAPNEQQKIADFLTALDDKIAIVEQQINKTELWKKGLLQQMFV